MLSRRHFLAGTLAVGAASQVRAQTSHTAPTVLRIERRDIEVNGKPASVLGIRHPDGTFGITTDVGKPFRVRVENHIEEPSLIHWHGLTPPWRQDGVPDVSGPAIPPGGNAEYDFPLRVGGTYWMHSHYGFQEQLLLSAPLIIRDGGEKSGEQDIILELADFSFTPPEKIFADLQTRRPPKMDMPGMAMAAMKSKPDLNDVRYDAFLANGRTLADPEVTKVEPGGRVRVRIVNSSSMSAYHIDLGELDGTLVAVDGIPVLPVHGRTFPIAVAQRLDIELQIPKTAAAYPVLAVLEGERRQTGIVLLAGEGHAGRISGMADAVSPPLTLSLERSLRAVEPLADRKADRTLVINLTGAMQGYQWSLNNVAWNKDVPPLSVVEGERVELVLANQTMMPHPMHLHGHSFQIVSIDGVRFACAVRDTVLVPPKTTVIVAFDADNPGWWAFHCHLLYHQHAGMFATLRYD
ncbi:MAG: Multicopper oxidase MmcO [Beijerinckiaceae bacterium]|jgi:FtsP/CotA-like multicopper oxidase with cupredoxin domain|nr:MAG: Multicopper oxidase MmcO [Beijerinckiaceae bacterium]